MNLAAVKQLYDRLPYAFKAPFAKLLRRTLLGHSTYVEAYVQLQASDSWTPREMEEAQFTLYKGTLIHAYEHTRYYRELFDSIGLNPYSVTSFESLKHIPLLTRDILRERLDDIIADDGGEGFDVTTGGTSGNPLTLKMSNEAHFIEWAFIYHYWSKFGYNPETSRLATFRGVKLGNTLSVINPMYNEIRMNIYKMNHETIQKYVDAITKYGADFIYGYPSAVYAFCKLAQEARIDLQGRYKAVFLISENLYPHQKEKIQEVLGCPIAMFYRHTERAVFAGRFAEGYAFNKLYGITEISSKGEPIVTGFINKKTPLIRYVVDDVVTPAENGFYNIEGHRNSEVIYGKYGEEFRASSIDFHGSLSEILPNYQFVQNAPGELIVRALKSDYITEGKKQQVIELCQKRLGNAFDVSVEVVPDLQYAESKASRKYRLLIQNIKTGEKR